MITNKMNEMIKGFCPTTILLNVGAITMSLTDLELGLKLLSYSVAVIWTILRIAKEIKNWNQSG